VFLVLLAAFEIPLLMPSVDRAFVRPFTTGIAHVSGAIIGLVQHDSVVRGTIISGRCFAVDIRNGCNGLEASLFLLAAVLAFPAPAKMRAIGAMFGFAIVQLANLIRIVSLYLIGCYRPDWFAAFHLAIWQTIIFAIAVGFFLVWTRRVTAVTDAASA
jgi:exosortase H (IPTLxxWG-CTERM-specific)